MDNEAQQEPKIIHIVWGFEQTGTTILPTVPKEFKGNSSPPIKFHSVQIERHRNRKKQRNQREKRKGLKFTDLNPQSPSEKDTQSNH